MSLIEEARRNLPYYIEVSQKPPGDFVVNSERKDITPIIGIHGWFGSWPERGIKQYMVENNIPGVLTNLGLLDKGIDHYLPQVDDYVHRYPNSIIVGMSAGAIVALRYVQKNGWDNIGKIIAVGAPMEGVNPLLGVLGKTVRDVSRNSRLLNDLSLLEIPENKLVSVFAKKDNLAPYPKTYPYKQGVIVGAEDHGDLQNEKKWLELILDAEFNIYGQPKQN
jgi:hypothetical protein